MGKNNKHNFDFSDLREAISSDATKENEELKKQIKNLKRELEKKEDELVYLKTQNQRICNRCAVLMGPKNVQNPTYAFCLRCGCDTCEYKEKANIYLDECASELAKRKFRAGSTEAVEFISINYPML